MTEVPANRKRKVRDGDLLDESESESRPTTRTRRDVVREIDERLLDLLFRPIPEPEPFALLTPANDAMRKLLNDHWLEKKEEPEIQVVCGPMLIPNAVWRRVVCEWRDAQKEQRAPVRVDVSAQLEVFPIPKDDPRVALRGAKGVRATADIAPGSVLVWYGGLLMTAQTPCGGPANAWALDTYGYHSSARDLDGETQLTVSAVGDHGGMGKFVNDARVDMNTPAPERVNAAFAELTINGHLPFVSIYATKRINKGDEVLVDYGDAYWSTFQARHKEHVRICDAALAIRKLLRRMQD